MVAVRPPLVRVGRSVGTGWAGVRDQGRGDPARRGDRPSVFLAAEKAGLVLVGIGARAGDAEVRYLAGRTGATALLTLEQRGQQSWAESVAALRADGMPGLRHIVVSDVLANPSAPVLVSVDGAPVMAGDGFTELLDGRGLGPDDLFLLNSTSGTTGLPKCVMHTQNRWFYFHHLAARPPPSGDETSSSASSRPPRLRAVDLPLLPDHPRPPPVVTSGSNHPRPLDLDRAQRVTVRAA